MRAADLADGCAEFAEQRGGFGEPLTDTGVVALAVQLANDTDPKPADVALPAAATTSGTGASIEVESIGS